MTMYVRVLQPITVSFSDGTLEYHLDQRAEYQVLPLWVAQLPRFGHLWTDGKVQVATDTGFTAIISSIPAGEITGEPLIAAGTTTQYWRGDKSWQTLNKAAVGLGSVDNTSDANKPISTLQQAALDAKQPLDAELAAIAALISAADKIPYFTAPGTAALANLSPFARDVLACVDAAAVRDLLDAASQTANNVFPTVYYVDVQAAVDACVAAGGGTVRCAPGPNYVATGGVHMLSRVALEGPPIRHSNAYMFYIDGAGHYRPGNISTTTGLAAYDGAYLVPVAGSTGPMVWAGTYDTDYALRNLTIYGVDVFGQNITPGAIPSWTNSFTWNETAGTLNSTATVACSVVQVMPQMVGQAITGTGIPASTTVATVNTAANTLTLSQAATSTITGTAAFTVAGGLPAPNTPIDGRQALSLGSGCVATTNRTRSLLENVYTWGCGSGGVGTMVNNRTWNETSGSTTSGSNALTLSSQTVSPLMIGAPVSGTGIPVGTVVATISYSSNRLFLSANATANGTGLAITIGGSTYTGTLQQVYSGNPGIYIGSREVVIRGVTCYMGGGDGIVIDGGDGHIDADNMTGFNKGWGLWVTINGGPVRSVGAIDSFQNGIYGGAGNYFIEGAGHTFLSLQSNNAGTQSVKFGRCINTHIYDLKAADAGLRFSTDAVRYSSITYAPPTGSASNPNWGAATNSGVIIFGGNITTSIGCENYLFEDAGASLSIPNIFGMNASGTTWNAGTPTASVFSWVKSFASGWRFMGGSFPDRLSNGGGLPAFARSTSTSVDAYQIYSASTGTAVAGFGPNAAFYQPINAQTLAVNGAVTFDASKGNFQAVTLNANATSSTVTNPKTGQMVTIGWIIGASGGFTYVWPTICKFAGGAAPTASTTAGWEDSVTFRYDGTNLRETSRSVAVR